MIFLPFGVEWHGITHECQMLTLIDEFAFFSRKEWQVPVKRCRFAADHEQLESLQLVTLRNESLWRYFSHHLYHHISYMHHLQTLIHYSRSARTHMFEDRGNLVLLQLQFYYSNQER